MGSSASKSVNTISISPLDDDHDEAKPQKFEKTNAHKSQTRGSTNSSHGSRVSLEDAETRAKKAEAEVKLLHQQLAEVESHNLELQDQVQDLEQRFELMEQSQDGERWSKEATSPDAGCMETIKAKDQYIDNLEQETKAVQQQIAKLKLRYKKKLRIANAKLAESKQDNSLRMFELKDEISRLGDEKKQHLSGQKLETTMDAGASEDDGRTRIILDLSSKVSEQDDRIIQLEQKLRDRDRLIEELKQQDGKPSSGKGQRSAASLANGSRGQRSAESLANSGRGQRSAETLANGSRGQRSAASLAVDGDPPADNSSCNLPAWTDSNEDPMASEMHLIQQEMRRLRGSKQKRKKKPASDNPSDFQRSSATSRDSGIVPCSDESKQNSPTVLESGLSGPESNEDDDWVKTGSCQGHKWGRTGETGSGRVELDPASIRQISAARNRRTPRSSPMEVSSGRSLPTLTRKHDESLHDADSLLQSIDDDLCSFQMKSQSTLPAMSVQS